MEDCAKASCVFLQVMIKYINVSGVCRWSAVGHGRSNANQRFRPMRPGSRRVAAVHSARPSARLLLSHLRSRGLRQDASRPMHSGLRSRLSELLLPSVDTANAQQGSAGKNVAVIISRLLLTTTIVCFAGCALGGDRRRPHQVSASTIVFHSKQGNANRLRRQPSRHANR